MYKSALVILDFLPLQKLSITFGRRSLKRPLGGGLLFLTCEVRGREGYEVRVGVRGKYQVQMQSSLSSILPTDQPRQPREPLCTTYKPLQPLSVGRVLTIPREEKAYFALPCIFPVRHVHIHAVNVHVGVTVQ